MADDLDEDLDDGDDDRSSSRSSGGRKKLLLFVVLPIMVLVVGVAAAFMFGLADPLIAKLTSGGDAHVEEGTAGPVTGPPTFVDIEQLVNLSPGARKKQHILKLSVALEVTGPEEEQKLRAMVPRINDTFQVYLRELRVEELEGSAGMQRLQEELLARVNQAVQPVKVKGVLFKEMLVQ